MALFAGHFGAKYVAAFTCTLNAVGVFARLPLGISFSAAVLVGNKLGAQRPKSAKIIYDCSYVDTLSFYSRTQLMTNIATLGIALSIASGLFFGAILWIGAEPISHGMNCALSIVECA